MTPTFYSHLPLATSEFQRVRDCFAPAATGAHIFHGCTTRRWTWRETIVTTFITVPAGRIETLFLLAQVRDRQERPSVSVPVAGPSVLIRQVWSGLGRIDGCVVVVRGCLAVDNRWLRGNLGAVRVPKSDWQW